jgi:hypothetical protein
MEKKSVGLLELETAVLECFLEKTPLSPLGVKQYLQEEKASMAFKNTNWANGVMLKSTLARMATNALNKALKPSTIVAGFKATGVHFNFPLMM